MKTLRSFLFVAGAVFGLQAAYGGYVYIQLFSWMIASGLDIPLGIVASLLAVMLLMVTIGSSIYCINAWWQLSVSGRSTLPELALERGGGIVFISVMAAACLGSFALCGGHGGIGIETPLQVTAAFLLLAFVACMAWSVRTLFVYHRLMSQA